MQTPSGLRASGLAQVLAMQSPLFDKGGNVVAMEEMCWKPSGIAKKVVLNWHLFSSVPVDVAEAFVAFMRHNISVKSLDHCENAFRELRLLSGSFNSAIRGGLRGILLGRLAELRAEGAEWRFHYLRDWYRWSYDQALEGFEDPEFFYELVALRIPGNRKGEAVMSEDPEEGPLDEIEEIALRSALRQDRDSLLERTLTWAFLALGCNPKNFVYLLESDAGAVVHNGYSFPTVDVPRIKKGFDPRRELKTRKLDASMADLFDALTARNRKLSIPGEFSRPMFARSTPRPDCMGTAIEKYAFHFTTRDLTKMVTAYVRKLGVLSHRTGRLLRVTPRRLRYTFATRKVQEGCSMEALAELLDHTDLQNIVVYYAGTSMLKRLDQAMAVSEGPLVDRFMGRIVNDESEAFDGGGRVKAALVGRIKDIGTCGSTSLCSLFPPFSCYLCPLFQPWRNAPHRGVLSDLILQRDTRIADTGREDDRIAKQYDEIILKVGQVVSLCEASLN
jgi:hypothetical protein